MTEMEVVDRKLMLKGQARKLITREMEDLQFQAAALRYKRQLERRITEKFDPELSGRLDCVQSFIDTTGRRPDGL